MFAITALVTIVCDTLSAPSAISSTIPIGPYPLYVSIPIVPYGPYRSHRSL